MCARERMRVKTCTGRVSIPREIVLIRGSSDRVSGPRSQTCPIWGKLKHEQNLESSLGPLGAGGWCPSGALLQV